MIMEEWRQSQRRFRLILIVKLNQDCLSILLIWRMSIIGRIRLASSSIVLGRVKLYIKSCLSHWVMVVKTLLRIKNNMELMRLRNHWWVRKKNIIMVIRRGLIMRPSLSWLGGVLESQLGDIRSMFHRELKLSHRMWVNWRQRRLRMRRKCGNLRVVI